MKKIIIELDGKWVLERRDDEKLPSDRLSEKLKEIFASNIKTVESSFTEVMLRADGRIDVEDFIKKTVDAFAAMYPQSDADAVLKITVGDETEKEAASDNETKKETADGGDKEGEEKAPDTAEKKEDGGVSWLEKTISDIDERELEEAEEDVREQTVVPKKLDEVVKKIDELVGAEEFKLLAREIRDISEEVLRSKTFEILAAQSYLFSVGDGCGLTSYLRLLGELIAALGVKKTAQRFVVESKLAPVKDSSEPFESVIEYMKGVSGDSLRVLCIDISEWINATDNRYFKDFLRELENRITDFIVVFRVPFVDGSILEKLRTSLNDLLFIRKVSFPPFTGEEIRQYAEKQFEEHGFTLSNAAWRLFKERITEEKNDGKFYGLNTVKKVAWELLYKKQLSNARAKKRSCIIGKSEAAQLCVGGGGGQLSGGEMLKKLVGSEAVCRQIDEIVAQIELSTTEKGIEPPCVHMRFVGNPGTGKTTVARIIGKILKERGVLKAGSFHEVSGRDLCGRYIGETAPKTASICRDAYGGVLFIDEAYSLYRGDSDNRDYGREALETLIAEMENHRNDFVVIMAGYKKDMDTLMDGNAGLKSRMPYTIEFPNFTGEQLYGIFRSMVEENFKADNALFDAAKEYFTAIPKEITEATDFANARFVRNLFERTWAKAVMRRQLDRKSEVRITKNDFTRAIAEKDFAFDVKKTTKIGF